MRKDYFNDPDAPKANAAVPSVTAVVVDAGHLLLVHRADNDLWALPGGRGARHEGAFVAHRLPALRLQDLVDRRREGPDSESSSKTWSSTAFVCEGYACRALTTDPRSWGGCSTPEKTA